MSGARIGDTRAPRLVEGGLSNAFIVSGIASSTVCGGATTGASGIVTQISFQAGSCGPIFEIALHELTYVIGFGEQWEGLGKYVDQWRSDTLHDGHCVVLRWPGGNAASPCAREVQTILHAYGEGGGTPDWRRHVVEALEPTGDTLRLFVGDTIPLPVWRSRLAEAPGMWCGLNGHAKCEDPLDTVLAEVQVTNAAVDPTIVKVVKYPGQLIPLRNGITELRGDLSNAGEKALTFQYGSWPVVVRDTVVTSPANFRISNCRQLTGPEYRLTFQWSPGRGELWRIISNSTLDPANGELENQGEVGDSSGTIAPRPPSAGVRYIWIRNESETQVSSWTGPIQFDYGQGCSL